MMIKVAHGSEGTGNEGRRDSAKKDEL